MKAKSMARRRVERWVRSYRGWTRLLGRRCGLLATIRFNRHPDYLSVPPMSPQAAEHFRRLWDELQRERGIAGPALTMTDSAADKLRSLKWSVCESEVLRDPAVKGKAREILTELANVSI